MNERKDPKKMATQLNYDEIASAVNAAGVGTSSETATDVSEIWGAVNALQPLTTSQLLSMEYWLLALEKLWKLQNGG